MPLTLFKKNKNRPPVVDSPEPRDKEKLPVNAEHLRKWNDTLRRYKDGKRRVEERIKRNEDFWKMRQWKATSRAEWDTETPSTPWLFTCIQQKLCDVVESYPTANFRPRQRDDELEARKLSAVFPVVMAQNDFEKTYKNVAEYTLKNGVGIYHVLWDGKKINGLGDVSLEEVGVFHLFWEPGIRDIQRSSYVFKVEMVDDDLLRRRYPETEGHIGKRTVDLAKYVMEEYVDRTGKTPVIEVYYKVETPDGRTLLHYCRYVDTVVLFASENEPEKYPNGWYDHGQYPFVVQSLYHMEDSLYGIGLVDIGADTQRQIDLLSEAMIKNALMGAQPRYFSTKGGGVDEDAFMDWRRQLVPCNSINEATVKPIESTPLSGNYMSLWNQKIEEMKYCTSNLDANNGAAPGGITAASAIAALQETGGKNSRAINKSFYAAFRQVSYLVLELIRQYYDTPRVFRLAPDVAAGMGMEGAYITFENSGLRDQANPNILGRDMGMRRPEFDIEITAEKANPYKKMEINELAISFFNLGFFNPAMTDQALSTLEMMDFDHKQDIMDKIRQNGTMADRLARVSQVAMTLAMRYEPQTAQMLAAELQGGGQAMPYTSVDPTDLANVGDKTGEIKQVEDARARARASTEVDG